MVKVLSTITIAHLVGLSCSEIFLFLLHPFKLIISASRGALLYYFLVSVAVISIKSSHLFAKRHVPCIFLPVCVKKHRAVSTGHLWLWVQTQANTVDHASFDLTTWGPHVSHDSKGSRFEGFFFLLKLCLDRSVSP